MNNSRYSNVKNFKWNVSFEDEQKDDESRRKIAISFRMAFYENNMEDFKRIIEVNQKDFDIFFKQYPETSFNTNEKIKVSFFDILCHSNKRESINYKLFIHFFERIYEKFKEDLHESKRSKDEKKKLKKYRYEFRKKIFEYSINPDFSADFISFLNVAQIISAIYKTMEILHEKTKLTSLNIEERQIIKFKEILRELIGKFYYLNFSKKDLENIFRFDKVKHCDATIDVLAEFLLDLNLEKSTIESYIEGIENKSTKIVVKTFYQIQKKYGKAKKVNESCIREIENYQSMTFDKKIRINKKQYSLFQFSCERGLNGLVKALLETKFDPNFDYINSSSQIQIENMYVVEKSSVEKFVAEKPMTLAFLNGHIDVLKILLSSKKFSYNQDVLTDILRVLIREKTYSNRIICDMYNKCFDILKEDKRANVSDACTYFLKSAVRASSALTNRHNFGIISVLLKNGASLNIIEESFDSTSNIEYILRNIPLKAFQEHLNDVIVPLELKKNGQTRHLKRMDLINAKKGMESKLEIDYSFLKPILPNNTSDERVLPEIDIIYRMSKINRMKPLITHPVIQIYLFLKWNNINYILWMNLLCYIIFYVFLCVFVYNDSLDGVENKLHLFLLIVFLVIHFMKELLQFFGNVRYYFKNWENWLELSIFSLTTISIISVNFSDNYYARTHLNMVTVFLASFEFLVLMCKFFVFSIYFEMFTKVIVNFSKFIFIFFILFFGFALIFHKLISKEECESFTFRNLNIGNTSLYQNLSLDCDETTDSKFFSSLSMSFFKTILMLAGEFEAGSIYFDNFPFISQIMISLFVLIITIVLYNFLNGLAISDIQAIRNDAEIVGLEHRIKVLWYIESIVFGLKFKEFGKTGDTIRLIMRSFLSRFLKRFRENHLIRSVERDKSYYMKSKARFYFFMKRNSLFCNTGLKIKVTNSDVYRKFDSHKKESESFLLVDKELIEMAETLIKKKQKLKIIIEKNNQHSKYLENRIAKIEEMQLKLQENTSKILYVVLKKDEVRRNNEIEMKLLKSKLKLIIRKHKYKYKTKIKFKPK